MPPLEYDQPEPVLPQPAPGPDGDVHVPGTEYRVVPATGPVLAISPSPQVVGALVQKCSPAVPAPNWPLPTTALIGEQPGCPLSAYCDEVGVPGLVDALHVVVINPVSQDPDAVVETLPPPLDAVT